MTAHRIPVGPQAAHDPRQLPDGHWRTRVLVVDEHPAARARLTAVVRADATLDPLGAVTTSREAVAQARRLQPDVVVLAYDLPDQDGLLLTHRLRAVADPPAVLLRCPLADAVMAAVATIAGADGLVGDRSDASELRYAIRWLANGGRWMPEVPPTTLGRLAALLGPEDTAIFRALLHGIRPSEIAEILEISEEWLASRRWAILQRLRREL